MFLKVKSNYKDCNDEQTRESLGNEPLKAIFDSVGGWPLLGQTNNKTWQELQGALAEKGFSSNEMIFLVDVRGDAKNRSKSVVHISEPVRGVHKQFYRRDLVRRRVFRKVFKV